METEKQKYHEFDFFKKNPVVKKIKEAKKKVSLKKNKEDASSSTQSDYWPIMLAAISIVGLSFHVEYAGWVLFLAFLKFGEKHCRNPFFLSVLGLLGLHFNVEYSGWLIFAAFIVD